MINFFKDSIRELKHVVWPTREETKNYFLIVVVTLILFGLYLFVVSTIFTKGLTTLRDGVNGTNSANVQQEFDPSTFIEQNVISAEAKVEGEIAPTIELKPTIEVDTITTTPVE